jgi:molybdopterin/thiamine biosynthesis adenylyltransferase
MVKELNPHTEVNIHQVRLTKINAQELVSGYDVVIDGSDNAATRYIVNDACVLEKVLETSSENINKWSSCKMGRTIDST